MARLHVFLEAGDVIEAAASNSGDNAWISTEKLAVWFDRPDEAEAMAQACTEVAEKMRASRERWATKAG